MTKSSFLALVHTTTVHTGTGAERAKAGQSSHRQSSRHRAIYDWEFFIRKLQSPAAACTSSDPPPPHPTPGAGKFTCLEGWPHTMTAILRSLSQAWLGQGAPRFLPLSSAGLSSPQANFSSSPRLPAAPGMVPSSHSTRNPTRKDDTGPGIWKLEQEDHDFKTNLGNLVPDSKQEKEKRV